MVLSDLKVAVGVTAEENDEEKADGDALDTEPDRDGGTLAALDAEHSKHRHDDAKHKTSQQEQEYSAVQDRECFFLRHNPGLLCSLRILLFNQRST